MTISAKIPTNICLGAIFFAASVVSAPGQGLQFTSTETQGTDSGRINLSVTLSEDTADTQLMYGFMFGTGNFDDSPCHLAAYLRSAETGVVAPAAEWISCGVTAVKGPSQIDDRLEVRVEDGYFITGIAVCEAPGTRELAGVRLTTKSVGCILGETPGGVVALRPKPGTPTVSGVTDICDSSLAIKRVSATTDKCGGDWQPRSNCVDGFVATGVVAGFENRDQVITTNQYIWKYAQGLRLLCRGVQRP